MSRPYPLSGYNFYVFINRNQLGFQRITNIQSSIETEVIQEGGVNYAYTLPAPPKQPNTMTFIKGSGTFENNQFPFKIGETIKDPIQIFVVGPDKEKGNKRVPRKHYCVSGAIVTKWSLSDFNSESGETLVESFEIQYHTLEQIAVKL